MNSIDYALCYKALGDNTRLTIYTMLKGGTMCGCKILEQLHCTQPTLSYHMRQLTECGLVTAVKNGKWSYYTINSDICLQLAEVLAIAMPNNDGGCNCGK